jgi:hypothetical protein
MKFIDRCRAGEFRNHPVPTEEDRQAYLRTHPISYNGTIKIEITKSEKEEREALIATGILPF